MGRVFLFRYPESSEKKKRLKLVNFITLSANYKFGELLKFYTETSESLPRKLKLEINGDICHAILVKIPILALVGK